MRRSGGEGGPPGWNDGGGFRAAMQRVFGDSDNPMLWAVTVGRVARIRVRLHVFFLLYAAATLLFSIPRDTLGVAHAAMSMAVLFGIVLLHEFGHCFAARWVGGEADDILLWPLGGLASVELPSRWRAHLWTALGGPAVNVLLLPVFAGALWAAGARDAVFFNPLRLSTALAGLDSWWQAALFWAHAVNVLVLGFNLLLPIYPLDGGRVLQALLWPRLGLRASMDRATTVGMAGAVGLGVFGLVGQQAAMVGVGVFGFLTCWAERRRLRAPEELSGYAIVPEEDPEDVASTGPSRREAKERERAERERAEVDRILAKIRSEGMGSLTSAERRTLSKATERGRRG